MKMPARKLCVIWSLLLGCHANIEDEDVERFRLAGIARTGSILKEVASYVDIYYSKKHILPDPDRDLYQSLHEFIPPNPRLWVTKVAEREAIVDVWDRPLSYSVVVGHFWLLSAGPNGIYENGQGDDISLKRKPEKMFKD